VGGEGGQYGILEIFSQNNLSSHSCDSNLRKLTSIIFPR